ncbi:MAG: hypothetical protein LBI53_08165 [Candidatus Peribacteria bacterium]|jgi:hypothetical protein|nr:hypothetical protein [Candidatus Peribacteria bacterium]
MWDTLVDFVANLHLVVTPVNGECGNVTQVIATTKPTTNLCKQGIV